MSIFSNLSLLFFETTEQTQLSMVEIENSFGLMRNYSEPNYVTGVFKSFTELNSYLIIFTTSFVGVVFFKILLFELHIDFGLMLVPFYLQFSTKNLPNTHKKSIPKVI